MDESSELVFSPAAGGMVCRRTFRPPGDLAPAAGSVLMLHGLGDHLGCHREAAALFCRLGYLCAGVDWPGHGSSPGRRGQVGRMKVPQGLLEETRAHLAGFAPAGGSRGLYAHSTGAFVALCHLARQGEAADQTLWETLFDWVWLASPLVRPAQGQPRWKLRLAEWLARVAPGVTLDTGVRPESCRHPSSGEPDDGCHHRVSAGFGADLLRASARPLSWLASGLRDPATVLVTQGGEDPVCPPEHSRELFAAIPARDKEYALLPGMRHEVLREPDRQRAVELAERWVARRGALPAP